MPTIEEIGVICPFCSGTDCIAYDEGPDYHCATCDHDFQEVSEAEIYGLPRGFSSDVDL